MMTDSTDRAPRTTLAAIALNLPLRAASSIAIGLLLVLAAPANAQTFPSDQNFTSTISSGSYATTGTIEASAPIASGASVTFTAPTQTFLPGFQVLPGSTFTAVAATPTFPVRITSSPSSGLAMTVDGASCTSPCAFQWTAGSAHTIATANQTVAGTPYTFSSWTDGGAISHAIAVSNGTYNANFTVPLAVSFNPTTTSVSASGGSATFLLTSNGNWTLTPSASWFSVSPASGSSGSGQTVTVTATANTGAARSGTISGGGAVFTVSQAAAVPSFTITTIAGPPLVAGATMQAATATVNPVNGFNQPVIFSCPSCPSGVSVSFSPLSVSPNGSTNVMVNVTSGTPTGNYVLPIQATAGSFSTTVTVTASYQGDKFWKDYGLDAGNNGNVVPFFAVYTLGPNAALYTQQILDATVQASDGATICQKSAGQLTTGPMPSTVSCPSFSLAQQGFGNYTFTFHYNSFMKWNNQSIPATCNPCTVTNAYGYPSPSVNSLSITSGVRGESITLTAVGEDLGIPDEVVSASGVDHNYNYGVTAVTIPLAAGIAATVNPNPVQIRSDGTIPTFVNTVPLTFDLTNAVPGTYNLNFTVFGALSDSVQFTVDDATPVITNVVQDSPLYAGGSAYVTLYGQYFGLGGTLSVCKSGSNPCANADITATLAPPYSVWNDSQINALLTAAPTASGNYDLQVTSTGDSANGFIPAKGAGGSPQQSAPKGTVSISTCPTPTVSVTDQFTLTPASSPTGTFTTLFQSTAGDPSGGTYHWTTNNASMVQLGTPSATSPTLISAKVSPFSSSHQATVTVTYTYPCGGKNLTVSGSLTFVLTPDTAAVMWVDGTKVHTDAAVVSSPSYVNFNTVSSILQSQLNSATGCATLLSVWLQAGTSSTPNGQGVTDLAPGNRISNDNDRRYANYFLTSNTGNYGTNVYPRVPGSGPPASTSDALLGLNPGNWRVVNTLQAYYTIGSSQASGFISTFHPLQQYASAAGISLEPCSGQQLQIFSPPGVPFTAAAGLHFLQNGSFGVTPDGTKLLQLAEGRVGSKGQMVNNYINHRSDLVSPTATMPPYATTTPYAWIALQFDLNGNLVPLVASSSRGNPNNNISPFSSIALYQNGTLVPPIIEQGYDEDFISLTSSFFYQGILSVGSVAGVPPED